MDCKPVVALARCAAYGADLAERVDAVLAGCGFAPGAGSRVLVKPNLVSAARGPLGCSQPEVVAAACRWLLDRGCRVTVADSPAFGTAAGVATKCGLARALEPLGLRVEGLGQARALELSFGASVGLSARAAEQDAILSVPRLKAHGQMRVTAAVKNLFGCVVGMRKALAHSRFGERENRFEAMLLDLLEALPPVATLLDAVVGMHVTGPTGGEPYPLGMLGGSCNPVALDTAAYLVLHLTPADVPLWREAQARGLCGARPGEAAYPLLAPQDFDAGGFVIPGLLDPVSFAPLRLARGALKRLYLNFR